MNEDDFLRCLEAAPPMGSHALLRPVNYSARHHRLTSRLGRVPAVEWLCPLWLGANCTAIMRASPIGPLLPVDPPYRSLR